MSKSSLKISDSEMQLLREAADVNRRSLAGQAEHWMRIGRAIEQSAQYSHPEVQRALRSEISVDSLPLQLQEDYFDHFSELMKQPTKEEETFFAAMREKGGTVGYLNDMSDELVTLPAGRS